MQRLLRAACLVGPTIAFFALMSIRASAYPGDVFTTTSPASGPTLPNVTQVPTGDYAVSTSTGAATYSVPIPAPPGRRGMQPALSLSYSSQNPLRGGVAAGWSLSTDWVAVDTRDGRLADTHYTSSLVGNQRLVRVDEPAHQGSGVDAYRGEHDGSYTRFERVFDASAPRGYWIARTLDGLTHYFGETPESRDQFEAQSDMYSEEGRWFLTRTVDRFGNTILYEYEKVRGVALNGTVTDAPVDIALKRVSWTLNEAAGLTAHARIDFGYAGSFDLCADSNVPIGARFTFRNGIRTYEGAKRLERIDVQVKEQGEWSSRRVIALDYDAEAMRCDGLHAPLRMLTSVQETAYAPGVPPIIRRPMTFSYGRIERAFDAERAIPSLRPDGGVARVSHGKRRFSVDKAGGWPTIDSMWTDLDGDAVPDLVQQGAQSAAGRLCPIEWRRGDGAGGVEAVRASALPTLPWAVANQRNDTGPRWEREGCSLAAQFSRRETPVADTCGTPANYTSYRLMDVTGDGRLDLVTALDYQHGRYDPSADTVLAAMTAGTPQPICPLQPSCRHPDTGAAIPCVFDPIAQGVIFAQGPFEPDSAGCGGCTLPGGCGPGQPQECRHPSCNPANEYCPCSAMYCRPDDIYAELGNYVIEPPIENPDANGAYWLFKGAPWGLTYSLENDSAALMTANPACRRFPETACGGDAYVWRVFDNLGDGTFAAIPRLINAPVPLESDRMVSSLGSTDLANASSWHAIVDIDGDGYEDAVWQFPENNEYGVADTGGFLVFRGDGHGNFRGQPNGDPYFWPTPPGAGRRRINSARNGVDVSRSTNGISHRFTEVRSTFADVNGDGLPDLIDTRTGGPAVERLQVYYNTGAGFENISFIGGGELGTVLVDPAEVATPSRSHQVSLNVDPDTLHVGSGYSIETVRLIDLDNDGLSDLVKIPPPDSNQRNPWILPGDDVNRPLVQAYMNTGDRFVPIGSHPTLERMRYALSRISLSSEHLWYVKTDLMDFDGDGYLDAYNADVNDTGGTALTNCHPNSDNIFQLSECAVSSRVLTDSRSASAQGMHFLQRVENGHGASVEYEYAPSTEVAASQVGGARSPVVVWVVTELRVNPASAPNTPFAPLERRSFEYSQPVFSADMHGRFGFRGFEQVTSYGPATLDGRRAAVVSRFDYSLDYSGRLIESVSRDHDGDIDSVGQTDWQRFSLFGGAVVAFHETESRFWTCAAGTRTKAECLQQGQVRRAINEWQTLSVDGIDGQANAGAGWETPGTPILWAQRVVSTIDHLGSTAPSDRRTLLGFGLLYGADTYQILPTSIRREQAQTYGWGSAALVGREEIEYDDSGYGFPVQTRTWLDEQTVAVTERRFDVATGLETHLYRPREVVSDQPLPVVTAYDQYRVLALSVTNELGQTVTSDRDISTGNPRRIEGPAQAGGRRNVAEMDYDALGRLVEARATVTDPDSGQAALIPVQRIAYNDAAWPRTVTREDAIGPGVWSRTTVTVDSLDRPVRIATVTSRGPAITEFAYDAAGNLVRAELPDPANDTQRVVSLYSYDELGRQVRHQPPEGAITTTSYDGLVTTIVIGQPENLGPDDSPSRRLEREVDVFGRLVRVAESSDFGMVDTLYTHDANDNLRQILDPDGIETILEHNFAGHRTAVRRGTRVWRFLYDLHGNLEAQVAPFDGPQALAPLYTTTWIYDELDRVKSKRTPSAGLNLVQLIQFGVGETIYEYDDTGGGNHGVGQLTRVRMPFAVFDYEYSLEALLVGETRRFLVPGPTIFRFVADERSREFQYNFAGQLTRATTGTDDHSVLHYGYDERGLARSLAIDSPTHAVPVQIAVLDRNLLGAPTARSMPGTPMQHQWNYDHVGRVVSHRVQTGGCTGGVCTIDALAGESLVYDRLGNVGESTNLGSGLVLEYEYDGQHQLAAVQSQLDVARYAAAFAYTPGGRLASVYVGSSDRSNHVSPRNVEYEYEAPSGNGIDPEAVWSLTDVVTGRPFAEFDYDSRANRTMRRSGGETLVAVYDGDDKMRSARVRNRGERYYYDHTGARMLVVSSGPGSRDDWARLYLGGTEIEYGADGAVRDSTVIASIDGQLVGRIKPGSEIQYVFGGVLASTLAVADEDANVLARFSYGPFGEILETDGPEVDEIRRLFNGKELDEVSRLAYYGARYYDRLSLTWTQPDPLYSVAPDIGMTMPRRMNRFSFSLNNPVRYVDPTGLEPSKEEKERACKCTILDKGTKVPGAKKAAAKRGEEYLVTHKVREQDGRIRYRYFFTSEGGELATDPETEREAARRAAVAHLGALDEVAAAAEAGDITKAGPGGGHEQGAEGGEGDYKAHDNAEFPGLLPVIDVTQSTSAIIDGLGKVYAVAAPAVGAGLAARAAAKGVPRNPYGRRGSPAHQDRISEAEERLNAAGFETVSGGSLPEQAVTVPGGRKRFPDLVVRNADGKSVAVQVGRSTKAGKPVARERRALEDLRDTADFDHVFFLKYF